MISPEDQIDDIATGLYRRVTAEADRILQEQLRILGSGTLEECEQFYSPNDPRHIVSYQYQGRILLNIRMAENKMGIEFIIPKIETQGGSDV